MIPPANERKLASVERIGSVAPVPNSDNLEVVGVKGWKVVIRKGEFREGDRCVFFEIDSFLPIRPEFEFLRASSWRKMGEEEGFRLRTVKLRGQLSQGLVVPIDILPNHQEFPDGSDVTEILGVRLFEIEIEEYLRDKILGPFPGFISKTHLERVQNLDYGLLREHRWTVTEKVDGQSVTIYRRNGHFGACTRHIELVKDCDHPVWKYIRREDIEAKLDRYGSIAIQGELIGPGTEGRYGEVEPNVRVFGVLNLDTWQRYDNDETRTFARDNDLSLVPLVETSVELPETLDELLESVPGPSEINSRIAREGLVYRSNTDPTFAFKVLNNERLLKEK